MRDLPLAFAVGQAPMTRAAPEMRPIQALASAAQVSEKSAQDDTAGEPGMAWRGSQSDRVSLGKAEQVASIQPRTGNMGDSAGADVGRQTHATAPPVPNTEALLTAPGYPRLPGSDRGSGHRRTHTYGVSVRPYAIRSSRGTWLFPPAPNAGANS
jgi:hypothetical protein